MSHTPGPWKLLKDGTIRAIHEAGKSDQMADYQGAVICDMTAGLGTTLDSESRSHAKQETLANANLIAAAPDLLAAIETLLADMEAEYRDNNGDCDHDGMDKARAAIAKAKGQ